jgi:hemerythrin superfamily protein
MPAARPRGTPLSRGKETADVDPIEMLTEDHRRVEQLFDQFQAATSKREKERVSQLVFKELTVHSLLEKELFYPTVALQDSAQKPLIDHSYHDHAEVEERIGLLKNMAPDDGQYEPVFAELIGLVKEHAREEEEQLFPDARRKLGAGLAPLGRKMQRRQKELLGIPV